MKSRIKENDLYVCFEVIEQLEPQAVLDVGMLLKRAGCVSRKAMNREIAEEIKLDGIDFTPEASFPVMKNIYNEMMDIPAFLKQEVKRKYDCAILIGIEMIGMETRLPDLLEKVQKCSKYVLTDCFMDEWFYSKYRVIDLKVDEDIYYFNIPQGE